MAHVEAHLSLAGLEEGYRACADACAARHYQAIWLLAQGRTIAEVSALTSFGERWIEQLLARYNALGPRALGDRRRDNGTSPSVLKPELLARLRDRLTRPPPDGGVWTSRKVADWMAGELGLSRLLPQRGWEALKAIGWSIQAPRPRNPRSADEGKIAAFKKTSPRRSPRRRANIRTNRSKSGRRTNTGSG